MTDSTPPSSLNDAAVALLRDLRTERGMTLGDVSDATGIPVVSLQRYLAGKRPVSVEQFGIICEALGMDVVTGVATAQRMRSTDQPTA